jgi:outer membrane protein OmpA-like peptidoglycan-associated protein
MNTAALISGLVFVGATLGSAIYVEQQVAASKERLANPEKAPVAVAKAQEVAVADHTDAEYCTPQFREVLARVVDACGLSGQDARRGCEPVDVKTFANISDQDFNALFDPLSSRGAILMFDDNSDKLDPAAKALLLSKWEERKGARYFFIVARASKTGGAEYNRQLSQRRANSVMFALEEAKRESDDLSKMVGMLWLGSEYAQLPKDYCGTWKHSRPERPCNAEAINRSAFVSWVDCRL